MLLRHAPHGYDPNGSDQEMNKGPLLNIIEESFTEGPFLNIIEELFNLCRGDFNSIWGDFSGDQTAINLIGN